MSVVEDWLLKGSVACSALLLALHIAAVRLSEPGYVISIYRQVPHWFVVLEVCVVVATVLCTVYLLSHGRARDAAILQLPFLSQAALFVVLPHLLGYTVLFGDPMTHLADVHGILAMNRIYQPNSGLSTYPSLHVLVATLATVTNLSPGAMYTGLFVLITSLMIVLLVIVGRQFKILPAYVLITSPLSFFNISALTPSGLAYQISMLLLIYLVSLVYEKGADDRYAVLFMLVSAGIWTQHPFVGVFLGMCFTALLVTSLTPVREWLAGRFASPNLPLSGILMYYVIFGFFGAVWFAYGFGRLLEKGALTAVQVFLGYSYKQQFQPQGGGVFQTLFGELGFSLLDVFVLLLQQFGGWLVLLTMGAVGVLLCMFQVIENERTQPCVHIFVPVVFGLAGVWSVAELTVGVVPSINFIRIVRPAAIVSPLLAAVALRFFIVTANKRMTGTRQPLAVIFLVALVLTSSLVIAAGGRYNNPRTIGGNTYVSPAEVTGADWFIEHKNTDIDTRKLGRRLGRYRDYLLGPEVRFQRWNELYGGNNVPPHFGYDTNQTFATSVGHVYYVESQRGRIMHSQVGDTDFTRSNFERHRSDPTVSQIYQNGNMNVSIVDARNG